jgi:hypothetical protein
MFQKITDGTFSSCLKQVLYTSTLKTMLTLRSLFAFPAVWTIDTFGRRGLLVRVHNPDFTVTRGANTNVAIDLSKHVLDTSSRRHVLLYSER